MTTNESTALDIQAPREQDDPQQARALLSQPQESP
jgi:hypothetical protein